MIINNDMEKTDYKSGWITTAWIERKNDTNYAFYQEFKDEITNSKLDDVALFVSRVNFKHRGNETDELYKYNRVSSPIEFQEVWDKYDNEVSDAIDKIKELSYMYGVKIKFN